MKSICMIAQRYPDKVLSTVHVFVRKLAWAWADMGIETIVISPMPVYKKRKETPQFYVEETPNHHSVKVYRPSYCYFGNRKISEIRTGHISADMMTRTCLKVIEREHLSIDVFYGHFICVSGICACRLGKLLNKPSFIGFGESTDFSIRQYGLNAVQKETKECTGFIAVSEYNRSRLIQHGIAGEANSKVFVNGVDLSVFYPRNKQQMKRLYHIPENVFVVSFVGQFSERKGIQRLVEAINNLENVYLVSAGNGPKKPEGERVLFSGSVAPEDVPSLLCTSDIFVLPTLNEGCPNAILEAMACGLPIVTSDQPFIYDILDNTSALLVDPNDIQEIADAIDRLQKNRGLREELSAKSLSGVKQFTIQERANNILRWMEERGQ